MVGRLPRPRSSWWCLALMLVTVGLAPVGAARADAWNTYDPSVGTLPDAQGWTLNVDGAPPTPTVSGGVMHQGPTGVPDRQYWTQTSPTHLDFTVGFALEFNLKVVSSPSVVIPNPDEYRTGWNAYVADRFGRDVEVAVAENEVILTTDGHNYVGPTTVTAPFNSTDAFHDYLLVAQGNVARLYSDGHLLLTLPLGATDVQTPFDQVGFGDTTAYASGETLLAGLRYTGPAWPGYYPDQGTVPDDQNWTLNTTGTPPEADVINGVLHQGPTGTENRQYWTQTTESDLDFTAGFALEFILKSLNSTANLSSATAEYRTGWNVYVADMNGRDLEVAISNNLIVLTTDGHNYVGPTTAVATFNTTDDFHFYRLVAHSTMARLYVDGRLLLSLPIGDMNVQTPFNQIGFGDTTVSASGNTLLAGLRYTGAPPAGAFSLSTPRTVSAAFGQTVTLSATLTHSDTGDPAGGETLWFIVGHTIVGSAVTDVLGHASVPYVVPSTGDPGVRPITVVHDSTAAFDVDTAVGALVVVKGLPSFSLFPCAGRAGTTVTLRTLFLSGSGPVIGRIVQFAVDGTAVGSAVSDAAGATLPWKIPAAMAPGFHNVTVSFAGDSLYNAATRTSPALRVKANVGFSLYGATGAAGSKVTLKTLMLSGGSPVVGEPVQFSVDGSVIGSAVSDASGAAISYTLPSGMATGLHNVRAAFAGDSAYNPADRTTAALTVTAPKANVLFSLYPATGSPGQTVTLKSLMLSAGAPLTGATVQFSVDGVAAGTGVSSATGVTCSYTIPLSATSGPHTVTVSFAGDATHNAATRTTAALTVP